MFKVRPSGEQWTQMRGTVSLALIWGLKEKVRRCWEPLRKSPKEKKKTTHTKMFIMALFTTA